MAGDAEVEESAAGREGAETEDALEVFGRLGHDEDAEAVVADAAAELGERGRAGEASEGAGGEDDDAGVGGQVAVGGDGGQAPDVVAERGIAAEGVPALRDGDGL